MRESTLGARRTARVIRVTAREGVIVGREAELGRLTDLVRAAERARPQLAVVVGPAGIGKTRLVEEVADRARRGGLRVGMGRCCQDGDTPPFWPWRAILQDLGAPVSLVEERAGHAPSRFARFMAVLQHLRADPVPIVVAIDDAHLADAGSLLLVRFLARERELPLMMLLAHRVRPAGPATEMHEVLAELARDAAQIPLSGISADAVAAFFTGGSPSIDEPGLLRAVAAVTKGNPLHLRAIAMQSGLDAEGLAGGLERALRQVCERLPDHDLRVIAWAALLGQEVSVHEAARMAETSPALAAGSLAQAAELGLAVEDQAGGFRFVHALVRRVAVSTLSLADRLEAHARAAALLAGSEPDRISRRAHHALAAAARSKEDAERAVETSRQAARALRAADGFESAALLLGRAAEVQTTAAVPKAVAALRVEHAEAVLACGRLGEARPLFEQAARTAEEEGDATALARAALGLGGVWLSEHRMATEAARMLAWQRRALAALPAGEEVLRARLVVRMAAEQAYRGGKVAAVLDAVEGVRRTGDAHALAEALSLAHHALLTPEHTWRRASVARELIAVAADAQDGLLSLIGLCWLAADAFLLGDSAAVGVLEHLRLRADALRCRSVLFIVRAIEVMLAIRAAEFDRAESAAGACRALGTEVGDADAEGYYGAHLCCIRSFQGRDAELADAAGALAGSPSLIGERERAFAFASALFALRAGRDPPARALLDRLARDGLSSIPASSSWLPAMLAVVEMAHALGDARSAQSAYDALLPYADLPAMASLAVVCFGSVHRGLGLAALASGKLDLGVEHLAAAMAANVDLGHRPAAIQAQAELGLARLRRAAPAEDARGRVLLADAVAAAEALGMGALAARWQAAAAALPAAPGGREPDAVLITPVEGARWRVAFRGHVLSARDRIGLRYLARLVAAPDRGIPALALVAQVGVEPANDVREPVMDPRALAAVRGRIRELRGQAVLTEEEHDELSTLTEELARTTGLGGRARSFANAAERARTAVRKAIKRAIDEISDANPAVGRHLEERIETGVVCRYRLEMGATRAGHADEAGGAVGGLR